MNDVRKHSGKLPERLFVFAVIRKGETNGRKTKKQKKIWSPESFGFARATAGR